MCINTVSYTHLDVYKRQISNFSVNYSKVFKTVWQIKIFLTLHQLIINISSCFIIRNKRFGYLLIVDIIQYHFMDIAYIYMVEPFLDHSCSFWKVLAVFIQDKQASTYSQYVQGVSIHRGGSMEEGSLSVRPLFFCSCLHFYRRFTQILIPSSNHRQHYFQDPSLYKNTKKIKLNRWTRNWNHAQVNFLFNYYF